MSSNWQRLTDKYNNLPKLIKFSILLILAGQFLGLIISPDKSAGLTVLLWETIIPIASLGLLLLYKRAIRTVLLALFALFLILSVVGLRDNPISISSIKSDLIVDTALFEIYPLSGLGMGGYEYHFNKNADKIIDADTSRVLSSPRSSLYSFWSSGGALALIGYLSLVILLLNKRRLLDAGSMYLLILLLVGPATAYPTRALFFLVIWVAIGYLLEMDITNRRESDV